MLEEAEAAAEAAVTIAIATRRSQKAQDLEGIFLHLAGILKITLLVQIQ